MGVDVHRALTDVVVRVTGCDPDAVTPDATFSELGIDSLALVEIADELGRRTAGYLPDCAMIGLDTISSLERTMTDHLDTPAPPWLRQAARVKADWLPDAGRTVLQRIDDTGRPPSSRTDGQRLAAAMAVIGAILGAGLGLAGLAAALVLGLPGFEMPALVRATTVTLTPSATPTATASATPSPTATPDADEPRLRASETTLDAGERLRLLGAIPSVGAGAVLQVQRRDAGSAWDDFPVTATTRTGGEFQTTIFQERAGTYQFRFRDTKTGAVTPEITVEFVAD